MNTKSVFPNAKLPPSLEEQRISDVIDGETVYTVPWAMCADMDGNLWLKNFTICELPGGTVKMAVVKKNGEYSVDVSKCIDHRWRAGEVPNGVGLIPVSRLITGSET